MDSYTSEPIDRAIDFDRARWLQCPGCRHTWAAGWDFVEKWDECEAGCPSCGILADDALVDRPPYIHAPDEAMANDLLVRDSSWFHTSFHSDWPRANYNPLDDYSPAAARQIQQEVWGGHDRWIWQQKNRALHVGTYESAIANLYRRLAHQSGYHDLNFHIYRLQLADTAVVRPGIFPKLSNFVGDADLDEVCPWPNEVSRYTNIHEDESSVSLAVRRCAILRIQSIKILDLPVNPKEVEMLTHQLETAELLPPPPLRKNLLGRLTTQGSNLQTEGSKVVATLCADIPRRIREDFGRGMIQKLNKDIAPETWAHWALGVRELAINPAGMLEILKSQPWMTVKHSKTNRRSASALSDN